MLVIFYLAQPEVEYELALLTGKVKTCRQVTISCTLYCVVMNSSNDNLFRDSMYA